MTCEALSWFPFWWMSEAACALLWRLTPGRIFRRRAFAAAKAMTANSSFYASRNVRQTSPSFHAFAAVQAGNLRLKATVPSNRQSPFARQDSHPSTKLETLKVPCESCGGIFFVSKFFSTSNHNLFALPPQISTLFHLIFLHQATTCSRCHY